MMRRNPPNPCQASSNGSRRDAGLVRAGATLLLLATLLAPAVAEAQTATRKFGRGLAAMTTCFLEIPGNMVKETRDHGLGRGLTLGFVKGLGGVVVRPLVGVYEFLTAPFEVPDGYAPLIEPEFPWSYFEEKTSTR
jgi:putative exosortase-associated protein (TIGR04073 family)